MIPFSGNPLNRASEKRTDEEWIAARRRDPNSYILPMWRLQPFIIGPEKSAAPVELGLLKPGLADSLAAPDAPCIFLGLEGVFLDPSDNLRYQGDPAQACKLRKLRMGKLTKFQETLPRECIEEIELLADDLVLFSIPRSHCQIPLIEIPRVITLKPHEEIFATFTRPLGQTEILLYTIRQGISMTPCPTVE